jgi:ethanolaminephosphotransferase
MITLIGFLFNLIPHILIPIFFELDFFGYLPPSVCIGLGACYFCYMVCDNCDGKQARRTKTSSPLGMLIDHGLDSMTSVVNNMIMQRLFQIGNGQ